MARQPSMVILDAVVRSILVVRRLSHSPVPHKNARRPGLIKQIVSCRHGKMRSVPSGYMTPARRSVKPARGQPARGQTDLEVFVEKLLNRSDPEATRGYPDPEATRGYRDPEATAAGSPAASRRNCCRWGRPSRRRSATWKASPRRIGCGEREVVKTIEAAVQNAAVAEAHLGAEYIAVRWRGGFNRDRGDCGVGA